jgi:bifunctional DNA-binding transcriptional regulator/antitoxin component of YhaV-PrlF toxin-antitoxin module
MVMSYPITWDARRRTTLPAELLRAAGLDAEPELVAYVEKGSIVLSSRRALVERARQAFRGTGRSGRTASAELEDLRRADAEREQERLGRAASS